MATMRNWMWTANLSNSIVGVSVLAMPFCIQQCGLILGLLLLLFSATLTKLSCGLLIRAAQISRRSSYEALALSTFGPLGKNIVEVSIIGLQLGTCIAFYVIIGDLAPPTIARMTGLSWSLTTLRTVVLCTSAVVIVLPLAMLRDISNLSSISIASLSFYTCFLFYLLCLALPNVFSGKLWSHMTWWDTNGIFKCLPIFSLAFACHTQLLIIYDAHPDPTLSRMSTITSHAVNLTASLYSLVAIGGYLTFCIDRVEGDILSNFYPSLLSQLIKLCFALSVVVSFPMMIFPCRVSIHSLISQIPVAPLETPVRIPQSKFIPITIFITFLTLAVAIILPQIETVLALTGATAGSLISFIYPAAIFLSVTRSKDDYRGTAKMIMGIGLLILMASTVSILVSNMDDTSDIPKPIDYHWPQPKPADNFPALKNVVLPSELVKHEGGAKDKEGGADNDDAHVEQYPDKVVATEATEAKQSSPTSADVQASDEAQTKEAKDSSNKLMSKLEVLEERVEKLESENEELKKESEKLAAQASDSKQDAENRATESLVKEQFDSNTVKNEEAETNKVVSKTDDDTKVDPGRDTVDIAAHKPVVDIVKSDPPVNSKLTQEHDEQLLAQDDTNKRLHFGPLKKEVSKTSDVNYNKNPKHGKQQSKLDDKIPALAISKDTDRILTHQAPDSQKLHLEVEAGENTEKHQDDVLLDKPAVNAKIDLPHIDQNSEEKIPSKPEGKMTKRSVDDVHSLEQNVPKLDTGDVGVLSRDLLHDSKQLDNTKLAKNISKVQNDKVNDNSQTTTPVATLKRNSNDTETANVPKRDILSLNDG